MSGYITCEKVELVRETLYGYFKIPNKEVLSLYSNTISSWFERSVTNQYPVMLQKLMTGNVEDFSTLFRSIALESFSFFDVAGERPERFYHAFVLGLLVDLRATYTVTSNKESGLGRYDVVLAPRDRKAPGFIFEFKKVDHEKRETLGIATEKALQQIRDKRYAVELMALGVTNITAIAIAFDGKQIAINHENI